MAAATSNAIFTTQDLVVQYNDIVVLDGASLTINDNDRIGLVGRNGCGKSTYLKILAGLQQPDSGVVSNKRGLVIGFLPQDFTLDLEKNIHHNIRQGARHVLDLIHDFESLPGDSDKHHEIEDRIVSLDGWTLDQRIETAMTHLGITDGDRIVDTLSGGEKRRVALCKSIVSRPDLLILDEPTNHLDAEAIEWVGEFLRNYPGAFLMVTHDRWFLDSVTNQITELSGGVFHSYTGNYSSYLEGKAQRQAMEETLESKRQGYLRRELDWVRRGPKARSTKARFRMDKYAEIAAQEGPEREVDMELVIPPPPPLGNRVVELREVSMELGDRTLIDNFSFSFAGGMRIGIAGRNGMGKTTLLRLILGELEPTLGSVKTGELIQFNYIDQSRLILNEDRTVLEEVSDGTEYVQFGDKSLSLRAYLKRFLFPDDRINCQVKYLSGGEKSRLLLARILKRGGNFIILDEPTNDLDLPTLRVLEEALELFQGCVLVVSHDRYFLNRICTGIISFEGDGVVAYSEGDYDYYLEKKKRATQASAKAAKSLLKGTAPQSKARKLTYKETEELGGMEDRIHKAEAEIERLEGLFAAPDFHEKHSKDTPKFLAEIDQRKAELALLYSRWEELEAVKTATG